MSGHQDAMEGPSYEAKATNMLGASRVQESCIGCNKELLATLKEEALLQFEKQIVTAFLEVDMIQAAIQCQRYYDANVRCIAKPGHPWPLWSARDIYDHMQLHQPDERIKARWNTKVAPVVVVPEVDHCNPDVNAFLKQIRDNQKVQEQTQEGMVNSLLFHFQKCVLSSIRQGGAHMALGASTHPSNLPRLIKRAAEYGFEVNGGNVVSLVAQQLQVRPDRALVLAGVSVDPDNTFVGPELCEEGKAFVEKIRAARKLYLSESRMRELMLECRSLIMQVNMTENKTICMRVEVESQEQFSKYVQRYGCVASKPDNPNCLFIHFDFALELAKKFPLSPPTPNVFFSGLSEANAALRKQLEKLKTEEHPFLSAPTVRVNGVRLPDIREMNFPQ